MTGLETMGNLAKGTSKKLALLTQGEKKQGLFAAAEALRSSAGLILKENQKDVEAARELGVKESLIDRLALNQQRVEAMASGLEDVAKLPDPVGEVLEMKVRPNGLRIGKKRVPLGVVGVIYESRPNVTADVFGLCFQTGNAVLLRGGKDAMRSNRVIVRVLRESLAKTGLPADAVQLLEDASHETAKEMMRLNQYLDVLIPRGGAGLIKTVVENSTVPVIETGTGNCHIYVDQYADVDMAVKIIDNAKTQRMGVCNACESLVVHEAAALRAIPAITRRLQQKGVEIRGDEKAREISPDILPAAEEDWGCEYLDAIISLKVVSSFEEAVEHINRYNTGHSESIITESYRRAERFLNEVDAAAVYVNASTRFTDGFEFGLGAEIGISTQKLHARGPMGLLALTTIKYIIYGDGQARE